MTEKIADEEIARISILAMHDNYERHPGAEQLTTSLAEGELQRLSKIYLAGLKEGRKLEIIKMLDNMAIKLETQEKKPITILLCNACAKELL